MSKPSTAQRRVLEQLTQRNARIMQYEPVRNRPTATVLWRQDGTSEPVNLSTFRALLSNGWIEQTGQTGTRAQYYGLSVAGRALLEQEAQP